MTNPAAQQAAELAKRIAEAVWNYMQPDSPSDEPEAIAQLRWLGQIIKPLLSQGGSQPVATSTLTRWVPPPIDDDAVTDASREVEQDARLPREPTDEMINAYYGALEKETNTGDGDPFGLINRFKTRYAAMYDAAMKDKP